MALSDKFWTADPRDTLDRWTGDGSADGWSATTVPVAFERKAKLHPDRVILRHKWSKEQEAWDEWTWTRYRRDVHRAALALIVAGLERHDVVSILGFNSPEWFCATLGAIFAGGLAAGVYPSNSADGLGYIVQHSSSRVLFVDSAAQLGKGLAISSNCPCLRRIVFWGPEAPSAQAHDGLVIGWEGFLTSGTTCPDTELQQRIAVQEPGGACYLSYTSGTTGNPKGVMMSHDVALFGFRSWFSHGWQGLKNQGLEERNISYLPLSHIGGSVDIFAPLSRDDDVHSTVHFAFPDALQGSLEFTLRDVRPTYFAAVPRVWQKLEQAMRQTQQGGASDAEVLSSVGLEHVKWALSGSAPIEPETLQYYKALGIRIDEIYGMTETNMSLMGNAFHQGIGTVGVAAVPGSVRLAEGTGEICVKNRALMMGYMHEPERTRPEFDADGWFHSGDVGALDADGHFSIVGRIKELIITAGGENIPPVPIEFALKDALPCVSNIVVIGDRQKMLVCLFTPKLEPNPLGDPMWLSKLALESKDVDPGAQTVEDALRSERWRQELERGVEHYNEKMATSRAQKIRKWALLPCDFIFNFPEAELTPTLKLKRDVVFEKYAGVIQGLYGADFVHKPIRQAPSTTSKL